ncbi:MAG: histidine kinase [Panacibacter sp.]
MKTEIVEQNRKYKPITKIKWVQHEFILVTALALMKVISYLWEILHFSQEEINMRYANIFKETHVPFNLYRNIILPDMTVFVGAYLIYLVLHFYFTPCFVEAQIGKSSKKLITLLIKLAVIILLTGVASDTATYFRHEWQFHYPGFSLFFKENNPDSQLSLSAGFFAIITLIVGYGVYAFLREFIIKLIERSRQREYNISIVNKITFFILQMVCVPVLLRTFHIVDDQDFFISFCLYLSAMFAMYISNVYWLFPMKGDGPFFRKEIIVRLLSTSFIYSIPLVVYIHEQFPVAFLYSWAEQLFIVTPLTWWYYTSNKEKILQLRTVEKELVRSKADIQFLRSQINPHFLFNVMNTLYGTALQENAERTAEGIQRLGDMMRFMLHENNLDFIEMNKEIGYLQNYIALQKLRTQSSSDILIGNNIDGQNCHHKIAPMLLLPFVENAFKHGISLKERSWIKIHLQCTEREICFEVHNSIHKKSVNDPEKERSGIGLKNVLERLKLIYAGRYDIAVNEDEKEYTVKLVIQP